MSVQPPTPRLRRALALGTAAAFGLGGLFAAPAFAETAPSDAPTSGATFEANSLELLTEDGVEAVGRDADGNVVIVASETTPAVADFDAQYENVVVQSISGNYSALATSDVVGGAGYAFPVGELTGVCSTGFSAWTPTGEPAVVSAGHCTDDGTVTQTFLTSPQGDTAGGGDPEGADLDPYAILGTFGFSQYGGPGNTPGEANDTSVDISVINVTNAALDLLPAVTDWSTAAQGDLSLGTTEISSTGVVDLAQPVSKSGRTTGKSTNTGELTAGWANVDDRVVKGFGGLMTVGPGDSGGAVYQGEKAVGIVSGGSPDGTQIWVADLQAGLALTGGYTIALAVDAPVLTAPANGGEIERGANITGTSQPGTTVIVTPAVGNAFNATSDSAGNWSFPAPSTLGEYKFSVQAKNGEYNLSDSVNYGVNVVPAPLTAPVISTPADGSTVETSLTSIQGTGLPLAQITVTGDVEGTAVVGDNGVWSVPADLGYGEYSISVTQSSEGETSPVATSNFTVAPVAPSISTPADGSTFAAGAAPTSTSGVGLAGATVTVSVNGKVVGTDDIPAPTQQKDLAAAAAIVPAALPGDNWEVALASSIVTGSNVISVTQTVDGITSAAATSTVVLAAAAAAPGTPGGNGDGLAVTGGPDLLPIGIAAWLLIAGGLATAVIVRKRRLATED